MEKTHTETHTYRRVDQNTHTERDRQREERAQLFDKFVAYELPFAYLLFESFGRQSCITVSYTHLTLPTIYSV